MTKEQSLFSSNSGSWATSSRRLRGSGGGGGGRSSRTRARLPSSPGSVRILDRSEKYRGGDHAGKTSVVDVEVDSWTKREHIIRRDGVIDR